LEREPGRNVEVMWLTGRLAPDHKTIEDFRRDNRLAIRNVCTRFVGLCREMGLLSSASAAIDGSKFKGGEQPRVGLHARQWSGGAPQGGTPRFVSAPLVQQSQFPVVALRQSYPRSPPLLRMAFL
jgi:hypothetical protein